MNESDVSYHDVYLKTYHRKMMPSAIFLIIYYAVSFTLTYPEYIPTTYLKTYHQKVKASAILLIIYYRTYLPLDLSKNMSSKVKASAILFIIYYRTYLHLIIYPKHIIRKCSVLPNLYIIYTAEDYTLSYPKTYYRLHTRKRIIYVEVKCSAILDTLGQCCTF